MPLIVRSQKNFEGENRLQLLREHRVVFPKMKQIVQMMLKSQLFSFNPEITKIRHYSITITIDVQENWAFVI
jgi:hypothetical protein